MTDACCAPNEQNKEKIKPRDLLDVGVSQEDVGIDFSKISAGWFLMGSDSKNVFPGDGEGPVRNIYVDDFSISAKCITVGEFARFVEDTKYRTEAETFGWSFCFFDQIQDSDYPEVVKEASWWVKMERAFWNLPDGHNVAIKNFLKHPVTHVSWNDANAFCKWYKTRLPTEAEWEYAARGGLEQKIFPWGDEFLVEGKINCNIFQGKFPSDNTSEDGFRFTAPVDCYSANGFGLYNVAGNVWEWTQDWFTRFHDLETNVNPIGPERGNTKVIKGGSFLCHDSYCNRYRVSARSSNTLDSSTANMGFRVVKLEG